MSEQAVHYKDNNDHTDKVLVYLFPVTIKLSGCLSIRRSASLNKCVELGDIYQYLDINTTTPYEFYINHDAESLFHQTKLFQCMIENLQ